MKPEVSTVTSKGQITIPVRLRKAFDLAEGKQVRFRQQSGTIIIEPVIDDVEAAFGLVKTDISVSEKEIKQVIKHRAGT